MTTRIFHRCFYRICGVCETMTDRVTREDITQVVSDAIWCERCGKQGCPHTPYYKLLSGLSPKMREARKKEIQRRAQV